MLGGRRVLGGNIQPVKAYEYVKHESVLHFMAATPRDTGATATKTESLFCIAQGTGPEL